MDANIFITAMILICVGMASLMLFSKPIKAIVRFVIGSAAGMAAVYVINMFFPSVNVGINLFTALITGFLGVPGIAVLVVAGLVL